MDLVSTDIRTIAYIESDAEFNRARTRGFWETMWGRILGRAPYLLSFAEAIQQVQPARSLDLGVRDVPIADIVGSVNREQDFTRHFSPCGRNNDNKERWRRIYTRAVTGTGFPPVELYKIGPHYFIEDGHHRVSVAKHLSWETVQAHVTELIA